MVKSRKNGRLNLSDSEGRVNILVPVFVFHLCNGGPIIGHSHAQASGRPFGRPFGRPLFRAWGCSIVDRSLQRKLTHPSKLFDLKHESMKLWLQWFRDAAAVHMAQYRHWIGELASWRRNLQYSGTVGGTRRRCTTQIRLRRARPLKPACEQCRRHPARSIGD